jgi:hypothetical protein
MFNTRQTKLLDHAAEFLRAFPGVSAPKLLHVSELYGYGAHLYEWFEDACLVTDHSAILACREQVFVETSAWPVPLALMSAHQKNTLIDRCDEAFWARCRAVSRWMGDDIRELVDYFADEPGRLREPLQHLPLRVYNPDVASGYVYRTAMSYRATHWSRWTLEPMGSGWPLDLGLERLDQALVLALHQGESLSLLFRQRVQLSALTFAFEALCEQGAYARAFAILNQMRDVLVTLESTT